MTIGIVGCGLIGGSIGLACRSNSHTVLGYEPDPKSAETAVERGCVTKITTLDEVAQSDLTFISVPPGIVESVLDQVMAAKPKHTVATDCTSVKGSIVRWLKKNKTEMFVPGHPMAGHEKSGPLYSSAWMFRGAKWIITPTSFTYSGAIKQVETVVKEIGATPVRVKADQHDHEVALLSHVPHALAAVLVRLAENLDSTEASAGSWRDLTRVGGVDPKLWSQILTSNGEEVARMLGQFGDSLTELKSMLEANDEAAVREFFEAAKVAKDKQK